MPLQNTIQIKESNVVTRQGTAFVPITDQDSIIGMIKKLRDKKADTSQFWATLGRQDNGAVIGNWSGNIVCSKVGNNSFTNRGRQIQEQAEQLCKLYSDDIPDVKTVTEKFIAMKDLNLGTDPAAKKLRLTVTLDRGEHCLTFLQHTDLTDTTSQNGVFEFIVPDSIEAVKKKNRLTYYFEVPQTSADGTFQTVIKVMTYKSVVTAESSDTIIQSKMREFDNAYGIRLFDATQNKFFVVEENDIATKIDKNKKTLLFIHGTISSIQKSYGDLYDSGKKTTADGKTDNTWIQKQVLGGGTFEQVIGFDHPTIVDSPQQNAEKLFSLLTPLGSFTKPVDIVTSSRGGLVGKCVINAKQNIMTVGRAATVACANGVELLDSGQSLGRLVSILAKIDPEPISKAGLLLLQVAVKFALSQPGINTMKKDDPKLAAILSGSPNNKDFRYLPLCGDYSLKNNEHPLGWKFMDLLLSAAMKNGKHDWVVETDCQVIVPEGFFAYQQNAETYKSKAMDTTHLRYFYDPMNKKAKSRIHYYLHDADVKSPKELPADF